MAEDRKATELLNPRRAGDTLRAGRSAKQTPTEQRFYSAAPRFEEQVRRVCGRSVIMLRAEIAEALVRSLEDLERDYGTARDDSMAQNRPVADLEARYGAAIVLVHLQVLSKVNELIEVSAAGAPVADVRRLADNLAGLAGKLAQIESGASVATTGDLNEEERNKIRLFDAERFVRVAQAVQLRREAQAATKRLAEGERDGQPDLVQRAKHRLSEIAAARDRLADEGDVSHELELDQILQQVDALLPARAAGADRTGDVSAR